MGLKPTEEPTDEQLQESFSILERIVGVETPIPLPIRPRDQPFSILERIVGVETDFEFTSDVGVMTFQYPRTDRWG